MSVASFLSLPRYVNGFVNLVQLLRKHHQLIIEMARREVGERHVGQLLGSFWAIGHPLIQMAVYVFIFAVVFKVKATGITTLPMDYTTYLLCGLIPWFAVQESLNKGVVSITTNANLVKQVVFPLEVLPVKGVITSFLTQFVATGALIVYIFIQANGLPWTIALLPALVLFQGMAMIGMCLTISVIGVFIRDLKELTQVFCLVNIYLMPVFYMPDMVPEIFRPVVFMNPFSYLAWCYQDVFYFGRIEHFHAWIVFPLLSVFVFSFGYRVFNRLKIHLGDRL